MLLPEVLEYKKFVCIKDFCLLFVEKLAKRKHILLVLFITSIGILVSNKRRVSCRQATVMGLEDAKNNYDAH